MFSARNVDVTIYSILSELQVLAVVLFAQNAIASYEINYSLSGENNRQFCPTKNMIGCAGLTCKYLFILLCSAGIALEWNHYVSILYAVFLFSLSPGQGGNSGDYFTRNTNFNSQICLTALYCYLYSVFMAR